MDKGRRDEQDAWERCEDVKRKMNKLSLTRNFYMRASQFKVRRNRAAIVAGKMRNRQLRRALNALREKERCALGLSDLARMQRRVSSLEKYHNEQLEVARAKTRTLAAASTDAEMAEIDLKDVLDQNTPPLRRQRAVTSEVREAFRRLQKVRALDRTCQQQLQPMLDERTIFDTQLETMARTVTNKHREFDQLMFMYHDATRSREAARGQLHQILKESFQPGVRYHQLFIKPRSSNNQKLMSQLEEAIANVTLKFHVKSMKDLFLIILEEERKRVYMEYLKEELKDMVENLKRGSASAKNLHEKVLKLRRKLQPESRAKALNWQSEKVEGANGDITVKIKEVHKPYKITGVKNKLAKMIKGTQKLIEKIEDGRLYNSENEHVKRILLQLEQKLVQTLRDLQRWVEEVKIEKAQELHDKVHRTSIMIQQSIETGYNAFDINDQRN